MVVTGLLAMVAPNQKVLAAGTCYTTTGYLQVSATTTTCTVDPSGRKVYRNTERAIVQPDDPTACYTGVSSGSGSFVTINYEQNDCAALEALRANAVAAAPAQSSTPDKNIIIRPDSKADDCIETGGDLDGSNCGIIDLLNTVFSFVSGGVALAVVFNIIVAGIQYSSAQGDPSSVSKAKKRIMDAVLALLMYALVYAFVQWLIPGGVF